MKRISLFIAIITLISCTSKKQTGTNDSANVQSQDKVYVVGMDANYPPFGWVDSNQTVVGFDADVFSAIADKMHIKFKMMNTPWEGIFTQLANGDKDILISAMTITEERKQSMDFSEPYFEAKQLIAVQTKSMIQSLADLKSGKYKVGTQTGTTGNDVIEKMLGKDNKNIRRFESTPLALKELENGGVDCVVADNGVVVHYVKNNPLRFRMITDESFPKENYGMAVKKGNSELLEKLNEGLSLIKKDGTYNKIYLKYFGVN